MGNTKSQESKLLSAESTKFDNNVNSSIHFNNIYQLHDNHTQHLRALEEQLNFSFMLLFLTLFFIILAVVIFFMFKKLQKRNAKLVEEKAQNIILTMIERGELRKNTTN